MSVSGVPWSESRYQSRNVTTVFDVIGPEATLELRLFQYRDVNKVCNNKDESPLQMWFRQQDERFAEKNEYHSGNHRVSHIAIWPVENETARWIPRSERAFSLRGKSAQR